MAEILMKKKEWARCAETGGSYYLKLVKFVKFVDEWGYGKREQMCGCKPVTQLQPIKKT